MQRKTGALDLGRIVLVSPSIQDFVRRRRQGVREIWVIGIEELALANDCGVDSKDDRSMCVPERR